MPCLTQCANDNTEPQFREFQPIHPEQCPKDGSLPMQAQNPISKGSSEGRSASLASSLARSLAIAASNFQMQAMKEAYNHSSATHEMVGRGCKSYVMLVQTLHFSSQY